MYSDFLLCLILGASSVQSISSTSMWVLSSVAQGVSCVLNRTVLQLPCISTYNYESPPLSLVTGENWARAASNASYGNRSPTYLFTFCWSLQSSLKLRCSSEGTPTLPRVVTLFCEDCSSSETTSSMRRRHLGLITVLVVSACAAIC